MEMSQGNPSIAILNKQKYHLKKQNQWQNRSCLGVGVGSTSGKMEDIRKRGWGVNMVEILCTQVCK
jgi:hypothetical protein